MRFIVICQHRLFSSSLCDLVKQYEEGGDVIESNSVSDALNIIPHSNATTLIVFYMQLAAPAWECLEELHSKIPDIPVLVIADFENNEQIRKAIFKGANGCVSTNFTWRTVTFVIQRILDGEIVSPPINYNIEKTSETVPSKFVKKNGAHNSLTPVAKLTPRQQEVLKLIQGGQSNKEIARELDMAVPTVKIHCAAIFKELGVKNRTQAAIDAAKYL